MNKFIYKSILFVFVLFIGALIFDYFYSMKISKINSPILETYNYIYSDTASSELLIIGSSRARKHYNMEIIEQELGLSAYNLGRDGFDLEMTKMLFFEYLKHCKVYPKFLTIDVFWLNNRSVPISYHYMLYPYLMCNYDMDFVLIKNDAYSLLDVFVLMIRYRFDYNYEDNSDSFLSYKGFCGVNRSFDYDLNIEYLQKSKNKIDSPNIVDLSDILGEIITIAKSKNISVYLINSPDFCWIRDSLGYPSRISKIEQIANKYQVPFVDFAKEKDFCNDTSFFYDLWHLNYKGATKYTSEIYIPWLKKYSNLCK